MLGSVYRKSIDFDTITRPSLLQNAKKKSKSPISPLGR